MIVDRARGNSVKIVSLITDGIWSKFTVDMIR